jgi:hypothetical protein
LKNKMPEEKSLPQVKLESKYLLSESGGIVLWILYREVYSVFCVWRHSTVNSVSGDIVLCSLYLEA